MYKLVQNFGVEWLENWNYKFEVRNYEDDTRIYLDDSTSKMIYRYGTIPYMSAKNIRDLGTKFSIE